MPKSRKRAGGPGASRSDKSTQAFVDAYRQGLGLAAVAVIENNDRVEIVAGAQADKALTAGGIVQGRWWCRRAGDAEEVATAAAARLMRRIGTGLAPDQATAASECVTAASRQRGVALYTDAEIAAAAMTIAERVEREVAALQDAGGLKSVNAAYRAYRLETSARGEPVQPYRAWMDRYKADLVREIAVTLRGL